MNTQDIRVPGTGANLSGVQEHNARLVLSLIQRHGAAPGSVIARETGLSAQTVSNILRKLEAEDLLFRGEPQRSGVGKPSVPMSLNPDGALSFGVKIGRRSADLAVMNLHGKILGQMQTTYRYPMPDPIFGFLSDGIATLSETLTDTQCSHLCGIGIAAPSEIWSWTEPLGAPADFSIWQEVDFHKEVAKISDLPLFTENDATAACRAEQAFGRGRAFRDYAYVFIGSFIGGGVVLESSVRAGAKGNAGAFGSLRVRSHAGRDVALIETASLYLLEAAIVRAGIDPARMWHLPQNWSAFEPWLGDWIARAALGLAHAIHSIGSVMDFEAVLIDGAFPPDVRDRLVSATLREMSHLDRRGVILPRPLTAAVGINARVIGAASAPIHSKYFLP